MKRSFFVLCLLLLLVGCQSRHRPIPFLPDSKESAGYEEIAPPSGSGPAFPAYPPGEIQSMGIPPRQEFTVGPMFSYDGITGNPGGHLHGGITRHLSNPVYGLGLIGEGYLGAADGKVDSGVRLLGAMEMFFLRLGLDHSFRQDRSDFICSFSFPLKRGGLLGRGDGLRIDWIPGRDHSLAIGLSIPLGNPYAGKTRPKDDRATHPKTSDPPRESLGRFNPPPRAERGMEGTLHRVRHAADRINRYTTPFFDQKPSQGEGGLGDFREEVLALRDHMIQRDEVYPEGHSFHAEVAVYHRSIEEAIFLSLVGGGETGTEPLQVQEIGRMARRFLFEEIILPYNRLFGRNKRNDSLMGYAPLARARFRSWLDLEAALTKPQKENLLYVFDRLVGILEENRRFSRERWGDSALVWLPLHYAFQPEECDSQEKMDALLEKFVREDFVEGNEIYYVINERFHMETARSIHVAEDYHLLWIHDYRGIKPSEKVPDRIGFGLTLEGYLAAMIERVRRYDESGQFPVYLILIDQFYFERNEGSLWLKLLENPLSHSVRLKPGQEPLEAKIREAQEVLRAAVAASSRLTEEKRRWGEDWIAKKIKVHVNVTNPSDYSFRSRHLIENFPLAPDNVMRDHRKIVFYDVTERDPGKGAALYGGLGIGEHYSGPNWEDRAILVRGPVLISLKEAARRVFLQQGFRENEVPPPLHPYPRPRDYEERVRTLQAEGWDARVMEVHNETGFGRKDVNLVKAVLYNLMPAGSIFIVPDAKWNSPFWGGMLVGAALRGCRVLVISPSLANAPSEGFPEMTRANELMERLIIVRNVLSSELERAGGMLKLGNYARRSGVGEISTKLIQFKEGVEAYSFLKEIFPFEERVYEAIEEVGRELENRGVSPNYLTEKETQVPMLHLKTNFLASGLLQNLMGHPGWEEVLKSYLRYRAASVAGHPHDLKVREVTEKAKERFMGLMDSFLDSLNDRQRKQMTFYLTVGSQNQSYRGILMDGEAAVVVSGHPSLLALMDLFFMSGLTTWIEDVPELERLTPLSRGWRRWISRYIMKAL